MKAAKTPKSGLQTIFVRSRICFNWEVVPTDRLRIICSQDICYLFAQNGDQKKEVAFAQCYFAVQTRKQEIIEERIQFIERTEARTRLTESEKQLSQNIYERGVDDKGFGRIRSKGDTALFGG